MTIPATLITEKQLEAHARDLLATMGLRWLDRELQLGSYKLDAIALDEQDRRIVVVELKTCAHIRSLGQLLLYRSALKQALTGTLLKSYEVDALLITTFLDLEVVDVVSELGLSDAIGVKVCVGEGAPFSLVDPSDAPGEQAWYQRSVRVSHSLDDRIKGWNIP